MLLNLGLPHCSSQCPSLLAAVHVLHAEGQAVVLLWHFTSTHPCLAARCLQMKQQEQQQEIASLRSQLQEALRLKQVATSRSATLEKAMVVNGSRDPQVGSAPPVKTAVGVWFCAWEALARLGCRLPSGRHRVRQEGHHERAGGSHPGQLVGWRRSVQMSASWYRGKRWGEGVCMATFVFCVLVVQGVCPRVPQVQQGVACLLSRCACCTLAAGPPQHPVHESSRHTMWKPSAVHS